MSSLLPTESPISPLYIDSTRTSVIKSTYRCPKCDVDEKNEVKNLIVCIDGTSNQFGINNTNIIKLLAKVDLESSRRKQETYYSSGIGTRPRTPHIFNRIEKAISDVFDMAVAWNMGEIIKDAYRWLAQTYKVGDRIYLFGFSRGAYQVRILAEMIHEVGLLETTTERQIGVAYDHYEAIRLRKPNAKQNATNFKSTFCLKNPRVHFVGVWDTVSSVGLSRGDIFVPVREHACYVRHALALDERRVKFMPEYFHKFKLQPDVEMSNDVLPYSIAVSSRDLRASTVSSNTYTSEGNGQQRGTKIKEVWFAGSHSDVGGKNRPGMSYQAGNVSLLWMRREATEQGLILKPTDTVWVPEDLDFGTSDSMSLTWKAFEYLPLKHQVTFSGAGEDARRWHRQTPRRIVPGQKVHASILYANAYKPRALLGGGLRIPIARAALDPELDNQVWETGLFDDTAAEELLAYLGNQATSVYLDKLLFMLQFREGKQCVGRVHGWREKFTDLIKDPQCKPLVKLVAITAYYETSFDGDTGLESPTSLRIDPVPNLSQDVLDDAKSKVDAILAEYKPEDGPTLFTVIGRLTNHEDLRKCIPTGDVLHRLVDLILNQKGRCFGPAMYCLNCLLHCEDIQGTIITKLEVNHHRILAVNDTHLLTAALRMVMTLAQIQEANDLCRNVKPRLRELAKKRDLVGLLAVEILFVLYDSSDRAYVDIHHPRVRLNISSALLRSHRDGNEQHKLHRVFDLGDPPRFSKMQKMFLTELTKAAREGTARERAAATMALLELSKTAVIRNYLVQKNLLDIFVKHLRFQDKALLAAYALADCLKFPDMEASLKDNKAIHENIINMLWLDYFDAAIGPIEGFQIFRDLMQNDEIRKNMKTYNITELLGAKLGKGTPKEARTSLICLDIFRSFDQTSPCPWTKELVNKGLECLQASEWDAQKSGIAILSALAQTKHGEEAIKPMISKIIEMLLPKGDSEDVPGSPSWMMGPSCTLFILAQNKALRDVTRETKEYVRLKHLYLTGTLVSEMDEVPWHIWTPNRTDVVEILDNTIKIVDGELFEGQLSLESATLPRIRHWDRLVMLLLDEVVTIAVLPALLGASAFLATFVGAPIYVSARVYNAVISRRSRNRDSRFLDSLRMAPDAQ